MKVLSVNKFYYKKGGSEAYFFGLNQLLQENQIEVIPFSMKDKNNLPNNYEKYFTENIDYSNMNFKSKIKNSAKLIYSLEAKNKINELIEDVHPDIAHLHIFQHQLSPSIIHGLKNHKVKIINTVHDFKVICPNYKMLNKNGNCEDCKGSKYYKCLTHSCVKDSKINSMISVIEAYVNKFIKSYSYVDKFICPSKFYKAKLIEFGIPEEKVVCIPNFVDVDKITPCYEYDNYIMYLGRLSKEKGIQVLIEAMKEIKGTQLYIVGSGPLEYEIRNQIKQYNLNNVRMLGFKGGTELESIIRKAKFIVVPSNWHENCPMTIIEAMAYGKSVLGSNSGGIPELIRNNQNGFIFETNNIDDLVNKINYLVDNPELAIKMGQAGRKIAEEEYNKQIHFNRIKEVYEEVLV